MTSYLTALVWLAILGAIVLFATRFASKAAGRATSAL